MLNKYVVMLCYVVKKEKDMLNNVLKKNKIHPQYVGKIIKKICSMCWFNKKTSSICW